MENEKQNKVIYYLTGIIAVVGIVLLDQYTKFLAVKYLTNNTKVLIADIFELHYLENTGAAFGILNGQKYFFVIITLIILIGIGYLYYKMPIKRKYIPMKIVLLFFISGAIGNMIDRIGQNYVVDFLYFKLINFPIFNVADIYVTVAAIALGILVLFYYKDEDFEFFKSSFSKKEKKEKNNNE